MAKRNRQYTEEQKEAGLVRARKWYATGSNKDNQLKRQREYYAENKEELNKRHKALHRRRYKEGRTIGGWVHNKYSGIPCMDCDRVYPFCAMDFDHRPEETKSFGIGTINRRPANSEYLSKVEKEIAKCDLVCACCHRIRTVERRK